MTEQLRIPRAPRLVLASFVLAAISVWIAPWLRFSAFVDEWSGADLFWNLRHGDVTVPSLVVGWGCLPMAIAFGCALVKSIGTERLSSEERTPLQLATIAVCVWTLYATIWTGTSVENLRESGAAYVLSVSASTGAGVWAAIGSALCLAFAAGVRLSAPEVVPERPPPLTLPASRARMGTPPSNGQDAGASRNGDGQRRWALGLSILVPIVMVAAIGIAFANRDTDSEAESTPTAPVPSAVAVTTAPPATAVVRSAAPVPAVSASAVQAQRLDVALYTAQALANAFATEDWGTARLLAPHYPAWSDGKYAEGFAGLDAAYVAVSEATMTSTSVDLWLTEMAIESRNSGIRTSVYCVHWIYDDSPRIIRLVAGKGVRTEAGDASGNPIPASDVESCRRWQS